MPRSALTLLHVDDSSEFLELTRTFLERLLPELEYIGLTDPTRVLDRVTEGSVDCVVSDYDMPRADGLKVLRELSKHGGTVPFVLFTGKGSEKVASEAISAGAADYLQKGTDPIRFELLAHSVRTAVERHRNRRLVEQVYEAMHLVDEGVSLVDDDGRFVYVNRSYAEQFGYEPEELVGQSWSQLYRNETDVSYIEHEVMDGLSAESPWSGKTLHERRDGSLFYADHHLDVVSGGFTVCRVRHDRDAGQVNEQSPPVVSD